MKTRTGTNVLSIGGDGMKGLFIRAAASKEKIIIVYMDSDNKITQRYVRIIKMDETYILVYCFYREKVRTLKIDHILSAGPVRNGVGA